MAGANSEAKNWLKGLWLKALPIINGTLLILACVFYIREVMERSTIEKVFEKECEETDTFPLPRNEAICSKNIKWIIQGKKDLLDVKAVDFSNEQECLKMAIDRFRGDELLAAKDEKEKVNSLTVLALLHFQHKDYEDACRCAKKALDNESDASLAQCIYATSYLYSKSAPDNERVQKEHLIPALLAEGDNKITPHVLKIYLNRLIDRIHNGESKPGELRFVFELLNAPAFSKNASKCVLDLTDRIVQEMKRNQNSIEVFAKASKCNLESLGGAKVISIVDVRSNTFMALKDVMTQILLYMRNHAKDFDKEYVVKVEKQLDEFNTVGTSLQTLSSEIKARILGQSSNQEIDPKEL